MLSLKKYTSFTFLIAAYCALSFTPFIRTDDFDDFLNDESTEDFLDHTTFTRNTSLGPKEIVPILVEIGIIPILKENFYLCTNELRNRSLLDLPIYLPRRWPTYSTTVGMDLFWNKTDRMFFTETSSAISSYLNIGRTSLLQALTTSYEQLHQIGLTPDTPLTPERVFPLLRNFTVEERRAGAMFHAEKRIEKIFLYAFMPMYYLERNMFATEREQEALERAFGRLDQASQDDFAKQHLISDKFGIGDTRFSLGFQLKDNDFWGVNLAFFTTLPTAFAFAKGINGSTFKKTTCPPHVDIVDLVCKFQSTDQKDAALQELKDFSLKALDNLSANILEAPLGNGGHLGLGFAVQTDTHVNNFINRPWADALHVRGRVSLEYLLPKTKPRYFLETMESKCAKFDALGLDRAPNIISSEAEHNEAYAQQVLCFFQQQLTQEFFPFTFNTKVHPGFIFRWTSRTYHEGENWYFALGNDFWCQSKEKLTDIEIPKECNIELDVKAARKPIAYEAKVWGTLAYKVLREDINWILSLNMDQSYANSGIGKSYTVSLGLEAQF